MAGIQEAIEIAGATLRFLPKYSPDLNPIEMPYSNLRNSCARLPRERFQQRRPVLRLVLVTASLALARSCTQPDEALMSACPPTAAQKHDIPPLRLGGHFLP